MLFAKSAYQAEYVKKKSLKVLEELESGQGFYIFAYGEALLSTEGKNPVNTDMVLTKGWNMVGLKISASLTMDDLFVTLNPTKKAYVQSIWKWDRNKSNWRV